MDRVPGRHHFRDVVVVEFPNDSNRAQQLADSGPVKVFFFFLLLFKHTLFS